MPMFRMPEGRNSETGLFVQAGDNQVRPRNDQPQIQIPATISFSSFNELVISIGMALRLENGIMEDETRAFKNYYSIKILDIPTVRPRRFYLLLPVETTGNCNIRLQPGDRLAVSMDAENTERLDAWSATVVNTPAMIPSKYYTALLSQPWCKESSTWKQDEIREALEVITFPTGTSVAMVANIIETGPSRMVYMELEPSYKLARQKIASLRDIQGEIETPQHIHTILKANDFTNLPVSSIYEGLVIPPDSDWIHYMKNSNNLGHYLKLHGTQIKALSMAKRLQGGFLLVHGPPGTGKTYWALKAIMPLLVFPAKISGQNQDPDTAADTPDSIVDTPETTADTELVPRFSQIMIVTSGNEACTGIAESALKICGDFPLPEQPLIVRLHSRSAEEQTTYGTLTENRPRAPNTKPAIFNNVDFYVSDMISHLIANTYEEDTKQQHLGVSDKRVVSFNLSLGSWMLRYIGLLRDDLCHRLSQLDAKQKQFYRARNFLESYRAGIEMDRDEIMGGRAAIAELRDQVMDDANIIVTTLSNAGHAWIRQSSRPYIMILENATHARESEDYNILTGYSASKYIMIGDLKQLEPFVHPLAKKTGLEHQSHMSLFARLQSAGLRSIMFDCQHRMVPEICELVSKIAYKGKLFTNTNTLDKVWIKKVKAFNCALFGSGFSHNLLFLNCMGQVTVHETTLSKENIDYRVIVLFYVLQLVANGVSGNDIVILTPYRKQLLGYKSDLLGLQLQHPDMADEIIQIACKTIDSFQGGESNIVFFDLTIVDKVGFVKNTNRLNVALSRGRYGLYLVGDIASIRSDPKIRSTGADHVSSLEEICAHFERNKLVVPVNPPKCHEQTSLPIFPAPVDQTAEQEGSSQNQESDGKQNLRRTRRFFWTRAGRSGVEGQAANSQEAA